MAYVYGHYRADSGKLFYIGKGVNRRAWDTTARSKHWRNVVNKHGIVVKIIEDNLTEEEAYTREQQLIEEIGLNNLVNVRAGGCGMRSAEATRIMTKNWQNPAFRERHRVRNTKRETWLPRVIAAAEQNTKLWQDEEWRNRQTERLKKQLTRPEQREKCESALRNAWQDDSFKERMSTHRKNMWQDPEMRARLLRKEPCPQCGKIMAVRSMGSHTRRCQNDKTNRTNTEGIVTM
jgi:hypothetical protein